MGRRRVIVPVLALVLSTATSFAAVPVAGPVSETSAATVATSARSEPDATASNEWPYSMTAVEWPWSVTSV